MKFLLAIFQSMKHIYLVKANIVLTMGSFTSVPIGIATRVLRKKLYLHEGNVIVGKANQLLSHFAKSIFISFPLKYPQSIRCKFHLFGMPLRPELMYKDNTNSLQVMPDYKVILVFGGSQGAKKINDTFKSFVLSKSKVPYQVFHITGVEDNKELEEFYTKNGIKANVFSYYDNMVDLYTKADLVICRSGASSLAELSYFGKSVIFIPLAIAADNHQKYNAELVLSHKGCVIIEEHQLERLPLIIEELLVNNNFINEII